MLVLLNNNQKEKVKVGSLKQPVAFPVIQSLWQTVHAKLEHKCWPDLLLTNCEVAPFLALECQPCMTMVAWTRIQLQRTLTSVSVRLNHDLLKCVRGPKDPPVCDLDGGNIPCKTKVPSARTLSEVFKNHVVLISSSLQSASCLKGRLSGRALCVLAPLPLPRCPHCPRWRLELLSPALSSLGSLLPSLSPVDLDRTIFSTRK